MPATLTETLLGDPLNYQDLEIHYSDFDIADQWAEWIAAFGDSDRNGFVVYADSVAGLRVFFCNDCDEPNNGDDSGCSVNNGDAIVCDSCIGSYSWCEDCEEHFSDVNYIDGKNVCSDCTDNNYNYCDGCDEYYGNYNYDHDHDNEDEETCELNCESPRDSQTFAIRNDGIETLTNDKRVTIDLPAGIISDVGINAIRRALKDHDANDQNGKVWRLGYDCNFFDTLGDKATSKDGTYAKRLSRAAYKHDGIKIPPALLATIGSLASMHSAKNASFNIEITRDFNQSASDFYHDESCWWTSYYSSRCALKSNGGFGMRTYGDNGGWVTGRAWVQPLKMVEGNLGPTFDAMNADAYMVFNGYGELDMYNPARILAQMVGMTYKKMSYACSPMYVNNDQGYLVAPESIVTTFDNYGLSLNVGQHSNLFAEEDV